MSGLSFQDAQKRLSNGPQQGATWSVSELRSIVSSVSAQAKAGTTTILYGADIYLDGADSVGASELALATYHSNPAAYSILDETDRGKFLASAEFEKALEQAIPDPSLYEAYRGGITAPDGQLSFFAQASKEFAGSANGPVIAFSPNGALHRTVAQIELPAMLDNLADPGKPHVTTINGIPAQQLYNARAAEALLGTADSAKAVVFGQVAGKINGDLGDYVKAGKVNGETKFSVPAEFLRANGVASTGFDNIPLGTKNVARVNPLGAIADPLSGVTVTEQANRLVSAARLAKATGLVLKAGGVLATVYTAYEINERLAAGDKAGAADLAAQAAAGWAGAEIALLAAQPLLLPLNAVPVVGQGLYVLGNLAVGVAGGLGGAAIYERARDAVNSAAAMPAGSIDYGYTYSRTPLPSNGEWWLDQYSDSKSEIVVYARRLADGTIQPQQFYIDVFNQTTITGLFEKQNLAALNTNLGGQSKPQLNDAGVSETIERLNNEGKTVVFVESDGQLQAGVLEAGRSVAPGKRLAGSLSAEDGVLYFRSPDEKFEAVKDGSLTVIKRPGEPLKISNSKNILGIDFGDAGALIGQQLGFRLAGGDKLTGALYSATLQTLGGALGDVLDSEIFSKGSQTKKIISNLDDSFVSNLKSAGIGAISSFLTAELVNALGLDGFAAGLANSATGTYMSAIIQALPGILKNTTKIGDVLQGVNVGNVIGGFIGSTLAAQVVQFDTIGGQIGASVGAALGSIAALSSTVGLVAGTGASATLAGVQLGALAGPVGVAIGAFVGFIVGGLIGSIFGGTPRSGADATWSEADQKFVVANAWSKKGGSKDAARSLAGAAAETFNSVIAATGGTMMNPTAVLAGNYGMRKKDYVYQTKSSKDQNYISFRVSSKQEDSFGRVVGYGVYQGLTDPDFQLAGGDVYVKRAIYNTFELGGVDATNFDTNVLLGNISSAQSYESYLANSAVINALVSAESDSAFAAETLINLARADELGLTRRHRSDWFGGFTFLLKEADANAANVDFGFDYDPSSGQVSRLIGVGNYTLGDTIDVAGQTTIEATTGADTIDLRTAKLADQRGYTVNGHLNDDIAASGTDFTAKTAVATFAANSRRTAVSVTVANDGVAEATEAFLASLTNAPTMRIMGGDAVATVVNGAEALPTLMVGDSYAWEDDGYAVFRVSLSKAATAAVTVSLALADGRASGTGVDFGSTGATNIQVSSDGVNWTNATSLTFTTGSRERFVRTAIVADNTLNPAYVPGGTEPQYLNVEGNERFTLSATVTAGATALANGTSTVTGTGTIVDGVGNEPLVWMDDVVLDESSGLATFTLSRSRALATTATVDFATSDRRALDIDIAATVDGGDGNDTIYASNLGDNLFGGAGNDTLFGGRLDDWLLGGDGDDLLDAGTADQAALGGDGNYLNGGAGNDTLRGREGSDWLEGGDGVDILTGAGGDDILTGGAGDNDSLKGGLGSDQYLLRRGDGLDVAEEDATGAPVASGAGDAITHRMAAIALWKSNPLAAGAIRPDWIGTSAGVQKDAVSGGEDAVVFGAGIDIGDVRLQRSGTTAAPGNDLIIQVMQTIGGVETFTGTQLVIRDWFTNPFKRVEWLKFADGNEIRIGDITSFIVGGDGNDVLVGTSGNDFVYGGAGNDKLLLLAGDDVGNGGTGNDMVVGDDGRDLIIGGLGSDELVGGKGSDSITGDAGADDIYGGADRDILSGGRGDGDVIVGGGGDDTFRYSRGDGKDTLFDEFANYWDVVWTSAGQWNTAAGYAYNNVTGEVTGPGGAIIRKNVGTAEQPDLQWFGRYEFDDATGTLKLFNPPANAPTIVANAGTDTIEFAPGINIQDVILRRSADGRDLVLAISDEDEELANTSLARDSVTIKDWYVAPGQIERLAFYQTGVLDIMTSGTTLIAGTDAADGTIAAPVQGTVGADWITGAAGDDVIAGGGGNDILAGNSGFDTLKGEAGDDVLYGGTGNDTLDGGAGKDVLVGGAGQDMASYASASAAVRVQLSATWANTGDAQGDEYYGIEDLTGSGTGDVLGGDAGQNEINGGLGYDTLMGNTGDDTYVWNASSGGDTIIEGAFTVEEAVKDNGALAAGYTVSMWAATGAKNGSNFYWRLQITGPDGAIVYDNSTFLYATATGVAQPLPSAYVQAGWLGGFARTNGQQVTRQRFDPSVNGGQDELEFGPNLSLNDLTFLASGNDLIIRTAGSIYQQVTIKDQFLTNSAVETLKFQDGLSVSLASILLAASGDQLVGTTGDDLIAGQTGTLDDNLSGGAGEDVLVGYAGNDILLGGAGDDVLEGGLGADTLDGGSNLTGAGASGDTIRYVRSAAAVVVDLSLTTAQGGATTSDSYGDILIGVENVVGSVTHDTITGDESDNRLFGLGGNDTIRGGSGNDVVSGDDANDTLYGDAGEDSLSGGDGNDYLYGGTEKDTLAGGEGIDRLYGDAGDDTLSGGFGADTLDGGEGNDVVSGDQDNDALTGGNGDDILSGGTGNDVLNGGVGNDRYVLSRDSGTDTLTDTSGTNALQFDASVSYDKVWMTRVGNDLRVSVIGGDAAVTITGFFLATGSKVKTIDTATHSLFLDHPETLNLITAMTAATTTPAVTPSAMPTTTADLIGRYWHSGGKAAPIAPTAPRQLGMSEDGVLAVDGNYGVIDHDQNVTAYSVKDGAGPKLGTITNFNAVTGAFTYTPAPDANGTDTFIIIVSDADGQATELPVSVTIAAVNDAPRNPVVSGGGSLSVVESAPGQIIAAGTVIGQIVATDPEGDVLAYTLMSDAGQRFAIDPDGRLRVTNPGAIDFESAQSHMVRVRVADTAGASTELDFVIAVTDGNEANALPASYTMGVNENVAAGTAVGTVAATDLDQSGNFASQRYYFLNGTVASGTSSDGRYAINAATGLITAAAALNFEGASPSKTYQVIARDNAGTTPYYEAQTSVTIGIQDVNEANSIPATYSYSVNENVAVGSVVGSVAATDIDSAGSTGAQQRYFFWNGSVATATSSDGRYAINASTGQVTVNSALNFEAGTPSVTYQVIARDNAGGAGFNQVQTAVTIAVQDLNEANSIPAAYAFNVNENVAVGTIVGGVTATDIDQSGAFASQRYVFWDGTTATATTADGRYAINSMTGQITVAAIPNYEAGTPSKVYYVVARDNAGVAPYRQAQTAVTIGIDDINEAPTSLNWTPSVSSVAERDNVAAATTRPAIALGTLSMTDPDTSGQPNASYTYTLSDSRFEVIGGVLYLKQDASFDYETGNIVTVTVTGADQTGAPFTIARAINIVVANQDDVFEGTVEADMITGQSGRDITSGFAGDDVLNGLAGNDQIDGGDGDDIIDGGDGYDTLFGQAGADTLRGGTGGDTMRGGTGDDILWGDDGNDYIYGEDGSEGMRAAGTESTRGFVQAGLFGGAGDDRLDGGLGDDYLDGGIGADQIIGGAGFDGVDYSGSTASVSVNLASGTATGGSAQGDTLSGIELVNGSACADTFTGSAASDIIYGNAGDDTILGGGGNDFLFGGDGNDTISAEAGNDALDGGAGNDILNGGTGNDVYIITRASSVDTINNYDPLGTDIDTIGFSDAMVAIADRDLWFERLGDDLKISVIGTTSSVQITNWYLVTDANSRANHKIDFIVASDRYSRTINIEALVTLMSGKTKPASEAARDVLMTDLNYKAQWATYWNSNAAPVIAAINPQTANEDTVKTVAVTVTDDITPNALVQMSAQVLTGTNVVTNAGITFGAADANGLRTMTINPLANASGTARIRVTATDAGGITSSQDFDVVVAGVADTPTITQYSSAGGTSGYTAGIALNIAASFPDADGSEVQEIWITGVPGGVTLSAGTFDSVAAAWKLTQAQLSGLKLNAPAGWFSDLTLTVTGKATENGGTATSVARQFTVVVNAAPTGATLTASVNENALNGTVAGTVAGTDPDGDALTYSMIDGAGGRFVISSSGVVSIGNAALINFETATSHAITVRVTDPRGEYIDRSLTVAVQNVNEANSLPATHGFGVNENVVVGTVVGAVTASDIDSTDTAFGQQRYYFWNGTNIGSISSDGRYSIDSVTGEIKTRYLLNFEAGTTSVDYTVYARDNAGAYGALQVQTTVAIAINNLNEQNVLPANYSFAVAELQGVGVAVGTVTATDPDGSGAFADQRYFFWDGTNASAFSFDGRYEINATTGAITTEQMLDYEGGSPSRSYSVIARDNAGGAGYTQDLANVTIGITNVNETPNAPDGGVAKSVFFDEAGLGSNPAIVGGTVATLALTDPDGTVPTLRFAANGNPGNWFTIVGNQVRFATGTSWDYEAFRNAGFTTADSNSDGRIDALAANVVIEAFDGNGLVSSPTQIKVFISDVNERPNNLIVEASNLLSETLNGESTLNGLYLARFTMADPDGTVPNIKIIGGNQNGWFNEAGNNHIQISSTANFTADWLRTHKGQLGVAADFTRDMDGDGLKEIKVATLTMAARDAAGAESDPFAYEVWIEDRNEAPYWTNTTPPEPFYENPTAYKFVLQLGAGDPDGPASELRYRFSDRGQISDPTLGTITVSPDGRFAMTHSGAVHVYGSQVFDFDTMQHAFNYSVAVYDRAEGANTRRTDTTLTINLQDVNEQHTLANRTLDVKETVVYGPTNSVMATTGAPLNVRSLMLSDPEVGGSISYRFVGGSQVSGLWNIDATTGTIWMSGALNYEALSNKTVNLAIEAVDNGSNPQPTRSATLTLNIIDVNEGPIVTQSVVGAQTAKVDDEYQVFAGQDGAIVSMPGVDPEAVGTVTYSLSAVTFTQLSGITPPGYRPSMSIDSSGQLKLNSAWIASYSNGAWAFTSNGSFKYEFVVYATDSTGIQTPTNVVVNFMPYYAVKPPIVFDLDGDGLELVSVAASAVSFEMNQDGVKDHAGWIGADDGFLALDRNQNGLIDDISEITFANDLEGSISDLEGLRTYDTNSDGMFDSNDAEFAKFLVWQDANGDGISQADELRSLAERGISGINLTLNLTDPAQIENPNDTHVYGTTQYVRDDGTEGLVGDVFLGFELKAPLPNAPTEALSPPEVVGDLVAAGEGTTEGSLTPPQTGGEAEEPADVAAPVVFDLDHDGAPLVALAESATRFDMNGDGIADETGWIEQGDALLALDRNDNGTIDNIGEISFVGDKAGAKTDLEGLAAFDTNGDGVLDGEDDRFVEFRLWVDSNADGKTDAGELLSLAEAGVTAISLVGEATGQTQVAGQNIVYNTATYTLANGEAGRLLDVGLAFRALSALPETGFQTTTWEMKSKKYRLTASGGNVRVTPKDARGVISGDAGQVGGAALLSFNDRAVGLLSTILLDLDGDGLEAKQAKKTRALFDMDGNGVADDTGWMSGADGMLVIDRDGDGLITDASEISFLSEKEGIKNAWEGLAVLDNTRDSKLSSADARFGDLKVWIDRNSDGISEADELKSLGDLGIKEISLRNTPTNDSVKPGQNLALSTAAFTWSNGLTATIGNVAMAFNPSADAPAPGVGGTDQSVPADLTAARAANLAQAMSVFGADLASGTLRRFEVDGMGAHDWFAASAA
ncbi:MAG: cadherin domain-containing protein [Novosphingobium sp.]